MGCYPPGCSICESWVVPPFFSCVLLGPCDFSPTGMQHMRYSHTRNPWLFRTGFLYSCSLSGRLILASSDWLHSVALSSMTSGTFHTCTKVLYMWQSTFGTKPNVGSDIVQGGNHGSLLLTGKPFWCCCYSDDDDRCCNLTHSITHSLYHNFTLFISSLHYLTLSLLILALSFSLSLSHTHTLVDCKVARKFIGWSLLSPDR